MLHWLINKEGPYDTNNERGEHHEMDGHSSLSADCRECWSYCLASEPKTLPSHSQSRSAPHTIQFDDRNVILRRYHQRDQVAGPFYSTGYRHSKLALDDDTSCEEPTGRCFTQRAFTHLVQPPNMSGLLKGSAMCMYDVVAGRSGATMIVEPVLPEGQPERSHKGFAPITHKLEAE